MAFNVSALTDYVDQTSTELLTRTMFESETASLAGNLQTGVKFQEALQLFDVAPIFQDGTTCGFNATGTVSFTQRILTVKPIKIQDNLCPKDLEKKWTQHLLRPGKNTDLTFEQKFTDTLVGEVQEDLEIADWQGDTTIVSNGQLNKYDGLIKIIDAEGSVVNGNPTGITTGTGIVAANIVAIMDGIFLVIPPALLTKPDLTIVMGMDTFRLLVLTIKNDNMFHYKIDMPTNNEFFYPGTNVKVKGLNGLNGTNRIFAFRWSNITMGVDLENEEEKFEMWWSQDNQTIRYSIDFKRGWQIAFPNEIVSFKLV